MIGCVRYSPHIFVIRFRYHEHDVEDDFVECADEVEEKCESITQGYTTSEECTKWPVRKCGKVAQKTTKKYSPETECKKVPVELCGPGACPLEQGPEECQARTQTVSNPEISISHISLKYL